jgi:hypothetical protein
MFVTELKVVGGRCEGKSIREQCFPLIALPNPSLAGVLFLEPS